MKIACVWLKCGGSREPCDMEAVSFFQSNASLFPQYGASCRHHDPVNGSNEHRFSSRGKAYDVWSITKEEYIVAKVMET